MHNTSSGATNNLLTASGVRRSDVRSKSISTATVATGVQVTLALTWST